MQQIPFIDLFKSAVHVSGYKLAHPQEHFLTVYTALGTMHRYCCRPAGACATLRKATVSFAMSVPPPAWKKSAPTE